MIIIAALACILSGAPGASVGAGQVLDCYSVPKHYFGRLSPLPGKVLVTAGVARGEPGGDGFIRIFGEGRHGRWTQLSERCEPNAVIMEGVGVLRNPVAGTDHLFVFTAGADCVGVGVYAINAKTMQLKQLFGVATKYQIIVRATSQGPKIEEIWETKQLVEWGLVSRDYLRKMGNPKSLRRTHVYFKESNTYATDGIFGPRGREGA